MRAYGTEKYKATVHTGSESLKNGHLSICLRCHDDSLDTFLMILLIKDFDLQMTLDHEKKHNQIVWPSFLGILEEKIKR